MVIGTLGRAIEWQKWLELPEGASSLLLRELRGLDRRQEVDNHESVRP